MDGWRFDAFTSTSASAKKGEMTAATLAHTLQSNPSMAPLDTYGCLNSPESPLSSIDCLGTLSRVHENPLFVPDCPSLVNGQNALKSVMDLREAYTVEPWNFDHIEEVVAGPSGHQPEPTPLLYDEKPNDCEEGRSGTPELHFADPIACEEISQDNIPIESEAHSMPHIAESDVILEPVSTVGNPNLNPSAANCPPKASVQGNEDGPTTTTDGGACKRAVARSSAKQSPPNHAVRRRGPQCRPSPLRPTILVLQRRNQRGCANPALRTRRPAPRALAPLAPSRPSCIPGCTWQFLP